MGVSPALQARAAGLRRGGLPVLEGVDLVVHPGEVVALVGPNGAGKSTLLGLLAGDLSPDEGEVLLAGRPVGSWRPRERARARAVLPQRTAPGFGFTAEQVVAMGRTPHLRSLGGLGPADRAIVREAMARTGVTHLARRAVPTLSGGESARVALARVLAQEAPAVLLDEPTAALDAAHRRGVMEIMRSLADAGSACLAVVHDLNLAAAHADRIVVLAGGRLAADGPPWEVLTPELVEAVFGEPATVLPHPVRGCPLVVT